MQAPQAHIPCCTSHEKCPRAGKRTQPHIILCLPVTVLSMLDLQVFTTRDTGTTGRFFLSLGHTPRGWRGAGCGVRVTHQLYHSHRETFGRCCGVQLRVQGGTAALHKSHVAPPDLKGGPGCVFLPMEAARRWRGAVVLPQESNSSTPQSTTGPLGCVRLNSVGPGVVRVL